ncbi:MAG: hypothetical protein K8963_04760 [Proteobacteria bacterium]|nr:hypothetical protein [Pseudomonadota bacterium]
MYKVTEFNSGAIVTACTHSPYSRSGPSLTAPAVAPPGSCVVGVAGASSRLGIPYTHSSQIQTKPLAQLPPLYLAPSSAPPSALPCLAPPSALPCLPCLAAPSALPFLACLLPCLAAPSALPVIPPASGFTRPVNVYP